MKSMGRPFPPGNTWHFALWAVGAVMLAGLALDPVLGGRGFPAPSWPENLWLLVAFILFQLAVWFGGNGLAGALGGTRLAVVTIGVLCLWAILLGSLPQVSRGVEAPMFQRVMQAPPFVFLLLLLLANLGWGILNVMARGLRPSSLFLCNHLGVYVVGLATLFGSGDVERLDVWVREGDLAWSGIDGKHHHELPFAIHLHRFSLAYFPSQLTLIDSEGRILLPDGTDPLRLWKGKEGELLGHRIEVLEFTESAPWSIPGDDPIPAAEIRVRGPDGSTAEGWVSCGSYVMPPVFLALGDFSLAMPVPRVRLYESRFTLVRPDGSAREAAVRVNEPLKVDGWWLYQKGYNVQGGPGERYSQIEAVRDPWLPVVYTGFGLMALGAVLALGRAGQLLKLRREQEGGGS